MKFKLIIDENAEEEIVATVHGKGELTDRIEELILKYGEADKVQAYTEDDMKLLSFSDIECITVEEGKTYAVDITGQKYRLKMRLYEIESLLPGSFMRINKSSIANRYRIEKFTASFSGAVDAVFKCGHREYVSRRCFAQIKRRMNSK